MRIVFAGTPEFSLPPLRALLASSHQVVGVLTQPDRPAGRGQQMHVSPVKQLALQSGIAVAQPASLRTDEGRAELVAWAPDLMVVVAYGLILPPAVLALPARGCLNIHASLLPRWRGAAPIQRAILAGDRLTGVTIMQMDAGLDTGPMLLTHELAITEDMTGGDLHDLLADAGAAALMTALAQIEAGTARPTPQPMDGATYAAKLSKTEARIDWARPAREIARQVRAFNPWPVAETRFQGEQLRVHRAQAHSGRAIADAVAPGLVLGLDDAGALRVRCGEGELAIVELQRAGKRVVTAREFANGCNLTAAVFS